MIKAMKRRDRIADFDNARAFLIYCVILGHVVERFLSKSILAGRVQLWIYLFHMPAFIFMAGLFSKKTVQNRHFGRSLSYLLLFYFLKAAFYVAVVYVKGADHTQFLPFTEAGIPWFCMAMFWWYIAAILIRNLPPAIVLGSSFILAVLAGYLPVEGSFLVWLRTVNFFPFFYVGYMTDPAALLRMTRDRRVRVAGTVVLVVAFAATLMFYGRGNGEKIIMFLRGRYCYDEIGGAFRGIRGALWRMTSYIVSFIMTLSVVAAVPKIKTWFTLIGRHTLPVFVFHGLFITVLIGRVDTIRNWMLSGHIFLHCVLFSVLILCLTMLPPFDWIVRLIFDLPEAVVRRLKESR